VSEPLSRLLWLWEEWEAALELELALLCALPGSGLMRVMAAVNSLCSARRNARSSSALVVAAAAEEKEEEEAELAATEAGREGSEAGTAEMAEIEELDAEGDVLRRLLRGSCGSLSSDPSFSVVADGALSSVDAHHITPDQSVTHTYIHTPKRERKSILRLAADM
jgi:hypothetical protein